MAVANGLMHAQALGWTMNTSARGASVMLTLVLVLLGFVGGRVMPFFTKKAIPSARVVSRQWIEVSGLASLLALAAVQALAIEGWPEALLLTLAGTTQLIRLAGWHDRQVWTIPILWILYTGYGWLAAGLPMLALGELGLLPRSAAVHALTAGAIGVFTLGMMARVALGHTGRPMRSPPSINVAFVTANLAAAVRVFGPLVVPTWYVSWILLSGALWVLTFGIFAAVYLPVLLRPRVDGRPG
jgi:uncharacterized protein involved in response to NO